MLLNDLTNNKDNHKQQNNAYNVNNTNDIEDDLALILNEKQVSKSDQINDDHEQAK